MSIREEQNWRVNINEMDRRREVNDRKQIRGSWLTEACLGLPLDFCNCFSFFFVVIFFFFIVCRKSVNTS